MRDYKGQRARAVRQINERYYHNPLIKLLLLVHYLDITRIFDDDDLFIYDTIDTYGYVDKWMTKKGLK